MPKFYTSEYARIKVRAAVRGMTFAALAKRCGITRQALEMSLKGGNPNMDGRVRLAAALDMKVEGLFVPLTDRELIKTALWYAGLKGKQR